MRAKLSAEDDSPELALLTAWYREWRSQLEYVSANSGCGCCVHIFQIVGPPEAIMAVPEALLGIRDTGSSWAEEPAMGPPIEWLLERAETAR